MALLSPRPSVPPGQSSRLRTALSDVPDSVIAEIVNESGQLISGVFPEPIGLFLPSIGTLPRMSTAAGPLPEVEDSYLLEAIGQNQLVEAEAIPRSRQPTHPRGVAATAVLAIPIRSPEGIALAAMYISRSERHRWTTNEVALLRSAARIAEADARLRIATHVIEERERTTIVLAELGAELSALRRLDDLGPALNRAVSLISGADACAVVELSDSRVRLRATFGLDDQAKSTIAAVDIDDGGPVGATLKTSNARYFESRTELLEAHPHLGRSIAPTLFHSWAMVPIVSENDAIGALVCHWILPNHLREVTRGALEEIGRIGGLALNRLRVQETAQLLAAIEAQLSASPTVERIVDVVTGEVRHLLGSIGAHLEMFDDTRGRTLSSGVAGEGAELMSRTPTRPGKPLMLTPDSDWGSYPSLRRAREMTGANAMLCQPILDDGNVIGILTASYRAERDCGPQERSRAEQIAVMLTRAIRRASLLDREREITNELQQSLLPDALPTVDGFSIVARYLGAEVGVEVGGDWFDCFPLIRGGLAIALGDIVGHGLEAAGATSQLRSACRALADLSDGPADIVERLDVFASHTRSVRFATMFYGELQTESGDVTFCRAGHLPPVLVDDNGGTEILEARGSYLIGLHDPRGRDESTCTIPPGGRLLIFTDGLLERRGETIDLGYDRLLAALERFSDLRGDELADAVVNELADSQSADDRCLLIVERKP